ncbi:MAG: GNAT family N-acetyltransferase [Anaerolineaceae bacterium]|nr:GNAT family N-acetyltransferase [Anaerolineaceae bacterium]
MQNQFSIQVDVVIRHATPEDLRGLEWFGLLTPFRETIERAYDRAQKGEIIFLVATFNDFPIGQVWVDVTKLAEDGVGIIWALRVMEPFQNFGIGTRLIQAAEQAIVERDLHTAEIGVSFTNLKAKRLYERLGYQVVRDHIERWSYTSPEGETQQMQEREWVLRKALESR